MRPRNTRGKHFYNDNERELGYHELEIALTVYGETGGEDVEKQPGYYLRR